MTPRHQRTLGRRKLLFALGGAAVALPAAAAIAPHALAGQSGEGRSGTKAAASLPLTIVNGSGSFDNASVHLYVVGNADGRQVRLTPDGTLAPIDLADNGEDGFTDYAISLSGNETTLSLPYMSGRIYVALGKKLKFKAVADGNGAAALQYPAGWVSSDPNFGVLHDCAEFTYNSAGLFCNTTMVDMFSVPLAIRLTGADDQTTGTVRPGAAPPRSPPSRAPRASADWWSTTPGSSRPGTAWTPGCSPRTTSPRTSTRCGARTPAGI